MVPYLRLIMEYPARDRSSHRLTNGNGYWGAHTRPKQQAMATRRSDKRRGSTRKSPPRSDLISRILYIVRKAVGLERARHWPAPPPETLSMEQVPS